MELQRLFGANVRHHRKAKGWTLEQLAGKIGVSRETIGKIERGVAAPLFETAEMKQPHSMFPRPSCSAPTLFPERASARGF